MPPQQTVEPPRYLKVLSLIASFIGLIDIIILIFITLFAYALGCSSPAWPGQCSSSLESATPPALFLVLFLVLFVANMKCMKRGKYALGTALSILLIISGLLPMLFFLFLPLTINEPIARFLENFMR